MMFYALLALFIKSNVDVKTSKHIGVISIFDKEFIKTGKFDKLYSKILHNAFDARQEGDYKEFVDLSIEDATEYVKNADEFLKKINEYLVNRE